MKPCAIKWCVALCENEKEFCVIHQSNTGFVCNNLSEHPKKYK